MKIAMVMEVPDELVNNLFQSTGQRDRMEVQLQAWNDRARQPSLGDINVYATWQSRMLPTLLFRVSDRFPLGEPMLIAQTGHYQPTEAELRAIVERMKDDRQYRGTGTTLSVRWRTLGPVEIQAAMNACINTIRQADADASTLWRFRDGGVVDEEGGP